MIIFPENSTASASEIISVTFYSCFVIIGGSYTPQHWVPPFIKWKKFFTVMVTDSLSISLHLYFEYK